MTRDDLGKIAWDAFNEQRQLLICRAEVMPWDKLPETDKETYRFIGEALARAVINKIVENMTIDELVNRRLFGV